MEMNLSFSYRKASPQVFLYLKRFDKICFVIFASNKVLNLLLQHVAFAIANAFLFLIELHCVLITNP